MTTAVESDCEFVVFMRIMSILPVGIYVGGMLAFADT